MIILLLKHHVKLVCIFDSKKKSEYNIEKSYERFFMTIQQLKYVIKTVECGSITEAARQLFISQPSLSAALKDIETEFGIETEPDFLPQPFGI